MPGHGCAPVLFEIFYRKFTVNSLIRYTLIFLHVVGIRIVSLREDCGYTADDIQHGSVGAPSWVASSPGSGFRTYLDGWIYLPVKWSRGEWDLRAHAALNAVGRSSMQVLTPGAGTSGYSLSGKRLRLAQLVCPPASWRPLSCARRGGRIGAAHMAARRTNPRRSTNWSICANSTSPCDNGYERLPQAELVPARVWGARGGSLGAKGGWWIHRRTLRISRVLSAYVGSPFH